MSYQKNEMFYKEQYKWTANANHDNPDVRHGKDAKELDRSEGYEMLDFINALAKDWKWENVDLSSYHNLERIIKTQVPPHIHKHEDIKRWIQLNYREI